MNRTKKRNKTKITPLKTQKVCKNLRKNNKNQQITTSHVGLFLIPKMSPTGTPKQQKESEQKQRKRPLEELNLTQL